MLFSGLLEISFAVSNRRRVSSWGWIWLGGIIDMILGFLPDSLPDAQHGSHSIHHRLLADVPRLLIRRLCHGPQKIRTRDWGWYVAFGILAVICSLIILWQPAVGALYAVYMISFAFLIIGFFRIMLSFELKNLHKRGKEWKEKKEVSAE